MIYYLFFNFIKIHFYICVVVKGNFFFTTHTSNCLIKTSKIYDFCHSTNLYYPLLLFWCTIILLLLWNKAYVPYVNIRQKLFRFLKLFPLGQYSIADQHTIERRAFRCAIIVSRVCVYNLVNFLDSTALAFVHSTLMFYITKF